MNIKDILAAKGGVKPLRAQIHQLFADSCHPFRNFPNSPSFLPVRHLRLCVCHSRSCGRELSSYKRQLHIVRAPTAWWKSRQHIFCQEIWPRAAEIWSTANPHIPEEDIVRWAFLIFFVRKCVSNLGSRTVDKAQQKSKEVKTAFKATVYPASRHEESRGVWGVWPILADGMTSSDWGHSFSIRVTPSDGMPWTSLLRFHYSLFVANLMEEARAPGCNHQMLRTVSYNLMLDALSGTAGECQRMPLRMASNSCKANVLVIADWCFTPCITRSIPFQKRWWWSQVTFVGIGGSTTSRTGQGLTQMSNKF